jgi:hypothetical protein
MLKKIFFILLLLIIAAAVGLYFYLGDKEQLKANLSTQLSASSGYEVDIQGDLNWQILPSIGLAASNIKMRDGETHIHVGKLRVKLDLGELTKAPEEWQLANLILQEVRIKDADFRIQQFALQDFALGAATPFQAQLVLLQDSEPSEVKADAAPIDIDGTMIYRLLDSKRDPDATLSDVQLSQINIQSQLGDTPINAQCTGALKEIDGAAATETDSLNVYNGVMDCMSSAFNLGTLTWPESKAALSLNNGRMSAKMSAAKGSLDISKLRTTLATISALTGEDDPAADWPDVMEYQSLEVDAWLQDEQANVDANIDNLKVAMQGTLAQSTGEMDLAGTLTIAQASAGQLIRLSSRLTDLPLPFYCKGTTAEPDCGPDAKAAGPIAKELIKREGQRQLTEKIKDAIPDTLKDKLPDALRENVPDSLKEGAKQLLNLFNR